MVGQIEIEIEAGQVAAFLLLDLIDMELGEQHSAFRMIRMRQRHEAEGKHVLVADIFGAHLGERFPGHASREASRARRPGLPCHETWLRLLAGRSLRS